MMMMMMIMMKKKMMMQFYQKKMKLKGIKIKSFERKIYRSIVYINAKNKAAITPNAEKYPNKVNDFIIVGFICIWKAQ